MNGLKDIPGYEGIYKASKDGQIYAVNYRKSGRLKKLKSFINSKGYLSLCLTNNGKGRTMRVHRLIAMAFLPNKNNLPAVNHKNGVKTDNNVGNLEWCTISHNNTHAYRSLGVVRRSIPVSQYTMAGVFVAKYASRKEASLAVGVHENNIGGAALGKYAHSAGFIWKNEPRKKPENP